MRRTISITLGQWTKGSPARCTAIQSLARGVETAKTPDTRGSERELTCMLPTSEAASYFRPQFDFSVTVVLSVDLRNIGWAWLGRRPRRSSYAESAQVMRSVLFVGLSSVRT
ncbi:unnamed protein product [Fusarium graminearum]|uniref:Uncharacterized protein n=1 Tax=Gibberella zeae TaxID=5518 RepID=A0A9N8NHM3_GIBZA|nr:unnamed protein product [Fusarium graminearum]